MESHWNAWAQEYLRLTNAPDSSTEAIQALIGQAASKLPRDNPIALSWFITALTQPTQKWFAAKVLGLAEPLPKSLIDPLLLAALLESNPSATPLFLEPCIKALGFAATAERVSQLVDTPGVKENEGVQSVRYWLYRVGA